MKRTQADIVVGALLSVIVLFGVATSLQLVLADDPGMGHMDSIPVFHYVGPAFASLVIASLLGGVYVVGRQQLFPEDNETRPVEGEFPAPEEDTTVRQSTADQQPEPQQMTRHPILDVLPDDEERILEPVIESPGITQVEVRDRSGFSRSKVSQTVTDLEKRGLLYRERQGRTYRIYPADDLDERV